MALVKRFSDLIGTQVGETRGRIGNGQEPKGHGGECCRGENIDGYVGCGIYGKCADVGRCPHSAWFSFHKMSRLDVSD